MALSLQDIIIGITSLSCPLLNYFILSGKMHILDCRRTHAHPNIDSFKLKVKINHQTEKYIASRNKDLGTFYKKWKKNFPLLSWVFLSFTLHQ